MKQIKKGETPFSTQNAILAYCLHMAGVPWYETDRPVRVLYSADILNKFTNGEGQPIYKGWELEDAVKDAHQKGLRGHIEYVFVRTPRLDALLAAYGRQVEELEKGEGFAHDLVMKVSQSVGTIGWDVTMVRLACIFLKMRLPFMDKWQEMIPSVLIKNEGRVKQDRGTIDTKYGDREALRVSGPGFKIIPLNASDKLKKKMGLT